MITCSSPRGVVRGRMEKVMSSEFNAMNANGMGPVLKIIRKIRYLLPPREMRKVRVLEMMKISLFLPPLSTPIVVCRNLMVKLYGL